MDAVKNWTNCLLIVISMIGIIEVIVPEGDTKKFVFLVTQVIVSIIIAVPIISFLSKDFSFAEVFDISKIEENDFYIDTLRSTVDRQTGILENVFSDKVVNEFNVKYPETKLSECKIYFTRDMDGKIKEIELIEVRPENGKLEDIKEIKAKVAEICEVSEEKVKVI